MLSHHAHIRHGETGSYHIRLEPRQCLVPKLVYPLVDFDC